jgi:hypothetical protein
MPAEGRIGLRGISDCNSAVLTILGTHNGVPEQSGHQLTTNFIRAANGGDKELKLAFSAGIDRLGGMKLMVYAYWWRFTYRSDRQRGAIV